MRPHSSVVSVTLTATSALRQPTAWPRHSSGTTSAKVELNAIASSVPGTDMTSVIHTIPHTCPVALMNTQGRPIRST